VSESGAKVNQLQKPETVNKTVIKIPVDTASRLPFYLVLLYIILEFARPQATILGLAPLRIPAIVTIILGLSVVLLGRLNLSDKQTKLFILLLAVMVLNGPLAVNNYWAYQVFRTMLITFVTYLGIIAFVDSFDRFKTLINIWLGIHVYLAIHGIIKGGLGVGGFLADENDFSMTLNMIIPFAFFMAFAEANKLRKIIYICLICLFLFVNMLTLSRGGFIGLVMVGIYCWIRSPKKIVSAVLIGLLVLFMFQYAPEKYLGEIKSIQGEGVENREGEIRYQGTGGERIYQWQIGWKMFLDNPILGVGQGNYPFRFSEYEKASGFDEGLHGRSRAGRAAHSIYFTLLPELGVAGTLIFAMMLYFIYKDLRFISQLKTRRSSYISSPEKVIIFYLSRAMEGSLIGFLFSGIFISILYYPNFWILMGFVVALKRVAEREYENNNASY